jgi:hypothetical protein
MAMRYLIRHPVTCTTCFARLVVICRPTEPTEPLTGMFSFGCPTCREWNAGVELPGAGVQRVLVDPRATARA